MTSGFCLFELYNIPKYVIDSRVLLRVCFGQIDLFYLDRPEITISHDAFHTIIAQLVWIKIAAGAFTAANARSCIIHQASA